MTPEEIALKLLHDIASCGGEVCECAGCGCRDAIAAALTAERERAEAYRLELATRDAGIAAVLKADGVDYTDELSAWMQLAAAYRAEREAREKAEYELQRWKEVAANKPDWEKLWAEQVEAREKAEAERDEQARLKWEAYEYNKTLLARAEKAEAERDAIIADLSAERAKREQVDANRVAIIGGLATEREAREKVEAKRDEYKAAYMQVLAQGPGVIVMTRNTALNEAADLCDRYRHPDGSSSGLAASLADAILALKEPKPGSDTNPWSALIEMVAGAIRDAEARGYRAAQAQAAEVADAAAQAPRNGDVYLCALECISEIRTAIRAMKPKETTDE